MNYDIFQDHVNNINFGKHLPTAVYLHEEALPYVSSELVAYIKEIAGILSIDKSKWNVIKLFKKNFKISLLYYPTFFEDSYPALHTSYTIDLERMSVRKASYKQSDNPPILHRKELFLPKDHPKIDEFKIITREAEDVNLYEKTKTIGFKKNWERLIKRKGYSLENGHLVPLEVCKDENNHYPALETVTEIQRHKTAISRDRLSSPMQLLARRGFLNGDYSVFDYGCGKGDDLRELQAHGIKAYGWDPNYKNDSGLNSSDIVNLGYVINVIENRDERDEALRNAFNLTNKLLVVSAMLGSEQRIARFSRFNDGVVTKSNTFQKYYSQGELKNHIEQTLKVSAIAAGPGIFFVFKDELEEQQYLLKRQSSRFAWRQLTSRPKAPINKKLTKTFIEKHKQLFDDFWETLLELGRSPGNDEFEYLDQIRKITGSLPKAMNIVLEHYGENTYQQARQNRQDDLLVYFALGFFSKRQAYSKMPESLKRDIKALFEKYTKAREQGKNLLFSLASPEVIYDSCAEAHEKLPASQLNGYHDLVFHRQYLNQCPKELRVYIGCAIQLYGDIDNVDLIKAHIGSGKVSFMIYDDWNKEVPLLKERIKIKLREQDIDFFDYVDEYEPQPLANKQHYI
jgi:DNA phosphorothioation-associated putative methyltransferase